MEIAECGEKVGDYIDRCLGRSRLYICAFLLFSDFDTTIDSFILIDQYSSSLAQPVFLLLSPNCLLLTSVSRHIVGLVSPHCLHRFNTASFLRFYADRWLVLVAYRDLLLTAGPVCRLTPRVIVQDPSSHNGHSAPRRGRLPRGRCHHRQ